MAALATAALIAGMAVAADLGAAAPQRRSQTAPEAFTSPLQSRTDTGALGAFIRIQIDRYTPERDRQAMTDALTHNGYPGFLAALRKAPAVGVLAIGDVTATLRWAREEPTAKGRAITLVTDAPLYFVGGGRPDAKPRAGFELAIVHLTVDDIGLGTGRMAAAARIKPDGKGGVEMEDYAAEPITLTSVARVIP